MDKNVAGFLRPDEKILWEGKPKRKIFSASDWINVPMQLIGLAIFIVIMFFIAPEFAASIPFAVIVFYVLLTAGMAYMAIGRFFVKLYVQARTEYYVTDYRVVVVKNLRKQKVKSQNINSIRSIRKKANNNGISKIIFGESPIFSFLYENTYMYPEAWIRVEMPLGFYDIDESDADEIHKILLENKSK